VSRKYLDMKRAFSRHTALRPLAICPIGGGVAPCLAKKCINFIVSRHSRDTALAVLIAAFFFGCDRPVQSMNSIQVEIDTFSGRPNPGWTLTDAETTELRGCSRAPVTPLPRNRMALATAVS